MATMLKLDAMQKYENALLENFSPSVLRELKRSNWSGLLREVDRLYSTMYHEWDSLQKDVVDIEDAVRSLTWTVAPYTRDGEEPGEYARQVASTVQDALWAKGEAELGGVSHSFTQLLGALCHHRFRGFNVHQIVWKRAGDLVYPAKYIQLPPQFMVWETKAGHPDRLLLVEDGMSADGVPFPKHQYIVALNTSGPDHPLYNATFYSLVNWFVAYKFGLGWFMEYAQKYGMPKQIIRYANEKERQQIVDDLSDESVLNTILLKEGGGRDFDFKYPTGGAASLPQAVLLQKAEEACHKAILGQTLTSDTSSGGGSLAQAKVHAGVQADVVMKVAEAVADVLNQQLIPAILQANYGRVQGLPIPELRCKLPQAVASIERAQFLKTALEIPGMEVVKSEAYEYLNLTQPGEGDETFKAQDPQAQPPGGGFPGGPGDGGMPPLEHGGGEGSGLEGLPESAAKDEVVMSARRSVGDAQPDPAQAWLAPIKKKLREARAAGASLSELREQIRAWKPDTRALATAMADNIASGFLLGSAPNDEEIRAENPSGCNQHGHGWVDPCPYGGNGTGLEGKSALEYAGGAENVNPEPEPGPAAKAAEAKAEETEKAEAEAKRKAEEAAKAEVEAKKKADEEAAAKAKAEAERKAEEARKAKEEAERKAKEEEEARKKAEEETARKQKEFDEETARLKKEAKDYALEKARPYKEELKAIIAQYKGQELTAQQKTALAYLEKVYDELDAKIFEKLKWQERQIEGRADRNQPIDMESLKKSADFYIREVLKKVRPQVEKRVAKLETPQKAVAPEAAPKKAPKLPISEQLDRLPDGIKARSICAETASLGEGSLTELWNNSFNESQQQILIDYTDEYYENINHYFRTGRKNTITMRMESVFENARTGREVMVSRGEGIVGIEEIDSGFNDIISLFKNGKITHRASVRMLYDRLQRRLSKGENITRLSHAPTSTSIKHGRSFNDGVMRIIRIPKGAKALSIAPISAYDGKTNVGSKIDIAEYAGREEPVREAEILISPHSQFRIIGVQLADDGTLLIEEELIVE